MGAYRNEIEDHLNLKYSTHKFVAASTHRLGLPLLLRPCVRNYSDNSLQFSPCLKVYLNPVHLAIS